MWRPSLLLFALFLLPSRPHAAAPSGASVAAAIDSGLVGRWDITVQTPDGSRPSWVELWVSGRDALVGRFVGIVGSARPITAVQVGGDSIHFAIPHQWENGEGELIELVHALRGVADGAIINAGAYSHTSLALRDAFAAVSVPFVELHVTNVYAREPERRHSMLAAGAVAVLCGFGAYGYELALRGLAAKLSSNS